MKIRVCLFSQLSALLVLWLLLMLSIWSIRFLSRIKSYDGILGFLLHRNVGDDTQMKQLNSSLEVLVLSQAAGRWQLLSFFSQAVKPSSPPSPGPFPVLVPTVNVRPAPSAMAWNVCALAKVLCWKQATGVTFWRWAPPSSRLSEVRGVELL